MAKNTSIERRRMLQGALTLAGGALLPEAATRQTTAAADGGHCGIAVSAGTGQAVAETTAGKVRGYIRNGIHTFKGIPYAGTTAGAGRFQPPTKPTPWAGVRSSMQYGPVSPQVARTGWANDEEAWLFSWDDGIPGEDCLRANVWTPGRDNKKRPVMVWLHGGGFQAGSGQELPSYDGENLARRGDVVVVSVNHRLGVLGYLNLAEIGGAKYAASANVGQLDLVAALEWVRDNIANFGGDPGNVTIFGQSGGGGKVSALLATPAAKGLFHKAIVQSGSSLRMATPGNTGKLAAAVVAELGLTASTIDQIQTVPVQALIAAGAAALRKMQPAGPAGGLRVYQPRADRVGWAPTVDGRHLPRHPFDPDAPGVSAGVPMLIGSTLNEFTSGINNPNVDALTESELAARVKDMYGDRAPRIVEAYRRANPKAKPFDLLSFISSVPTRQNAVTQATLKSAQGGAPAYLYLFTWQTPVLDGRPRAFHCSELAFVFDNIDRCVNMTGGGADARALAARMSEAWIAFARTGNPNHAGLPTWPSFSGDKGATMIFDNDCAVRNDPDGAERRTVTLA